MYTHALMVREAEEERYRYQIERTRTFVVGDVSRLSIMLFIYDTASGRRVAFS